MPLFPTDATLAGCRWADWDPSGQTSSIRVQNFPFYVNCPFNLSLDTYLLILVQDLGLKWHRLPYACLEVSDICPYKHDCQ